MAEKPQGLRYTATAALLVGILTTVSSARTIHPINRGDTFDSYLVSNKFQCQRLCWYRQLCYSFSYTNNFTEHFSPKNGNCVLHAPQWHLQGQGLQNDPQNQQPEGWTETVATNDSLTNGCAGRPCSETTICVPAPSGNATCLPYPVFCDPPQPLGNADVNATGLGLGALAYVSCAAGFKMTPADAAPYNQIRCLIIRRWSRFEGHCEPASTSDGQLYVSSSVAGSETTSRPRLQRTVPETDDRR